MYTAIFLENQYDKEKYLEKKIIWKLQYTSLVKVSLIK